MDAGLRAQDVAARRMDTGSTAYAASPIPPLVEESDAVDTELAALARSISAARRKLGTHLEASLFANPGLDIMLFLFAEGLHGATVTTNACCAAAGTPPPASKSAHAASRAAGAALSIDRVIRRPLVLKWYCRQGLGRGSPQGKPPRARNAPGSSRVPPPSRKHKANWSWGRAYRTLKRDRHDMEPFVLSLSKHR